MDGTKHLTLLRIRAQGNKMTPENGILFKRMKNDISKWHPL